MLDELITISFDLDYKILQQTNLGKCGQFLNNLENPKLETDDIFSEYEKLIITSKEIISNLLNLLNSCDDQRKVKMN